MARFLQFSHQLRHADFRVRGQPWNGALRQHGANFVFGHFRQESLSHGGGMKVGLSTRPMVDGNRSIALHGSEINDASIAKYAEKTVDMLLGKCTKLG